MERDGESSQDLLGPQLELPALNPAAIASGRLRCVFVLRCPSVCVCVCVCVRTHKVGSWEATWLWGPKLACFPFWVCWPNSQLQLPFLGSPP